MQINTPLINLPVICPRGHHGSLGALPPLWAAVPVGKAAFTVRS